MLFRSLQARDLTQYALTVIAATAEEQLAHDAVLAELDKSSGGKTLWRALSAAAAMA